MSNKQPLNRIRLWEQMDDIRNNSKGRIYANMFSVKEFAKTFNIGINTVYRLCKIEGFPVVQIGGKKYIIANEFNDWVIKNIGKVV